MTSGFNTMAGRKLLRYLSISLFLLFFCTPVYSAGSMTDPGHILEKNRFKVNFEIGYLSKIEFKDTTANATRHISDGTVQTYQYSVSNLRIEDDIFSYLSFNYGVTDWLTLFAKAGMVTDGKKSSGSNSDRYYKLHDNFTWGLGGKARIWESGAGGTLTLSAQYQRYDDREQHRAWASSWATDFEIDLWQFEAALTGSWDLGGVIPYAGIKYARANLSLSGSSTGQVSGLTRRTYSEYDSDNKDSFGVLGGVAWDISSHWRLLIQGDFVSQTSGTISLGYQF